MARVVRKVSKKAAVGQKKKGIFKNKLFRIIAAIVLVIGLTVGITLGVVLNQSSESEGNTVDYFENSEVAFTKGSYASVLNYTNLNYENPQNSYTLFEENVFIFAYDLSSFYPDPEDEDNYNENHKLILERIIALQEAINKANTEFETQSILFIVDTSKGQNSSLIYNSTLGGDSSLETSANQFMFSYIQHGELKSEEMLFGANDKKYSLCSNVLNTLIWTTIPQTINFVNSGLVEL